MQQNNEEKQEVEQKHSHTNEDTH